MNIFYDKVPIREKLNKLIEVYNLLVDNSFISGFTPYKNTIFRWYIANQSSNIQCLQLLLESAIVMILQVHL